jgi:deoxyribose-phosphate aldolase
MAAIASSSTDTVHHVHLPRNTPRPLDMAWVNSLDINMPACQLRAATHLKRRSVKKDFQAAWLLRAVTCIDLTTLDGGDTQSNVDRLCFKAVSPIRTDLVTAMDVDPAKIRTGAVCVYPEMVPYAVKALADAKMDEKCDRPVPIASVATGFPAGQTPLKQRLEEITMAINYGATEIDMVIKREYVLNGKWQELYDDVKACREACGERAHLKTILAVGDLGTFTNIAKASVVAMLAGSDFIKTSTGKEGVNATFPIALVMIRQIREYYERFGVKVGFKPAGGVRSAKDCLGWLSLMKDELGDEWTTPDLFRIGASSLLGDVERQLYHHVHGKYAAGHQFPMA